MPVVRPQTDAFGELLKTYLTRAGKTQGALAAELGLSKWTVSRFVSGWRRPEPDLVIRIAAVLDTDPNPLLHVAGYLPEGYRVGEQVVPEPMMRLARMLSPGWEDRLARWDNENAPTAEMLMHVVFGDIAEVSRLRDLQRQLVAAG